MPPLIESNLALVLFAPWFIILGVLFWCFPRLPRTRARRAYDAIALLAGLLVFLAGIHWAHAAADPGYGPMWRQVLATAVGYAAYLAAMTAAFLLRRRWLRRVSAT